MQEKLAIFAATAANTVVFTHDLLEAGSGFLGMILGVLP